MSNLCGIDFGTSNSTIGILKDDTAKLVNLEGTSKTIPTAIFYEEDDNQTVYGRKALNYYRENYNGRLLRSLKSILGTSLNNEKTFIRDTRIPFTDIIQDFLIHIKQQAEHIEQTNLDYAVIGRPINFVDGDDIKNKLAQDTLERIARNAGFKDIAFQYEPIAASLKYEQSLTNEELVLIIDIGGGTTDISVINLSPKFTNIKDRNKHCLANHGVHIGGTDFDKHLNLQSIMPLLGYNQSIGNNMIMPKHLYHDMSTWHRINNIYTSEFKRSIMQFKKSLDPIYYDRVLDVIEDKLASSICFTVEESKIELSTDISVNKDLSFIESSLNVDITQADLSKAINNDLQRIGITIDECLSQAQITRDDISSIFLTGGSSQMALIKQYVNSLFPNTKIDNSDSLSSVGTGLVLDAINKYK